MVPPVPATVDLKVYAAVTDVRQETVLEPEEAAGWKKSMQVTLKPRTGKVALRWLTVNFP